MGTVGAYWGSPARHRELGGGREVPVETIADDQTTPDDDPETAGPCRIAGDEVRAHLSVLTARERDAVAMRFGARLSSSEIGAALGFSAPAARMLVYRAVGKLRKEVIG